MPARPRGGRDKQSPREFLHLQKWAACICIGEHTCTQSMCTHVQHTHVRKWWEQPAALSDSHQGANRFQESVFTRYYSSEVGAGIISLCFFFSSIAWRLNFSTPVSCLPLLTFSLSGSRHMLDSHLPCQGEVQGRHGQDPWKVGTAFIDALWGIGSSVE